jgi:hypothetical protein
MIDWGMEPVHQEPAMGQQLFLLQLLLPMSQQQLPLALPPALQVPMTLASRPDLPAAMAA